MSNQTDDNSDIPKIGMRDFSDFLRDLDNGRVNGKLTVKLAELIGAVKDTGGKAGKLMLAITIKGDGGVEFGAIGAEVKLTKPERSNRVSAMFFGPGNTLTLHNPNQTEMPKSMLAPPTVKVLDGGGNKPAV